LWDSRGRLRPHKINVFSTHEILLLSTALMRAAAIFGLGCSANNLKPFQTDPSVEWCIGMPSLAEQADIILIFGGDGTVHRKLAQLVALNLPVLVVPAGSGNDFARALGLRCAKDSLRAWQKFCHQGNNVRKIDLGVIRPLEAAPKAAEPNQSPSGISETYFCTVAGVGLDAEVARRANTLPRWLRGHGGYALSLFPTLFRFAPFSMKIHTRADDLGESDRNLRSDQPTMLAAFANTSSYGGGMKIAPNAKVDDRLLDVCVVGGVDPFKLACMFPTIYFGRHLRIREVTSFQAANARVETQCPLDVYADGEYVCRTPVEITVQSGALKILMP
jgi:diacylglycerol kinase (ATP)